MLAPGPASKRRRFGGAGLVSMHDMAAILGAILRGHALSVRGTASALGLLAVE